MKTFLHFHKTYILVCLFAVCNSARCQDAEYDRLFEKVFENITKKELRKEREQNLLKDAEDYLRKIIPSNQLTHTKSTLVFRYKRTEQRWKDDLAIAKYYFAKKVSMDDMDEAVKWMENEKFLLAQKDLEQALSEIKEKEATRFAKGLVNSVTGQNVPRIKAVKCPESYEQIFRDYFRHSDMKTVLNNAAELIKAELEKQKVDAPTIIAYRVSQYLKSENVENLFLNACYGKVSEEQLKLLTEQVTSASNQHIIEAYMSYVKDTNRVRYMEQNYLIGWLMVQDEVYEVRKRK